MPPGEKGRCALGKVDRLQTHKVCLSLEISLIHRDYGKSRGDGFAKSSLPKMRLGSPGKNQMRKKRDVLKSVPIPENCSQL
jgi:hypothetical protein